MEQDLFVVATHQCICIPSSGQLNFGCLCPLFLLSIGRLPNGDNFGHPGFLLKPVQRTLIKTLCFVRAFLLQMLFCHLFVCSFRLRSTSFKIPETSSTLSTTPFAYEAKLSPDTNKRGKALPRSSLRRYVYKKTDSWNFV